ncbi:MAG TPA: ribonuclease III, partial [Burkholderiales bacterium]
MSRPAALEERLGHRFADPRLLEQALTHRSRGADNNERLEFLGDGVLGCAVADELYARFPQLSEGKLTRLRASLVREETLAQVGKELGVDALVRLGEGELAAAPEPRPSILADALEAVLGAVFLDGGYAAARNAVLAAFGPHIDRLDPERPAKDAKTRLQELLQARHRGLPQYRV